MTLHFISKVNRKGDRMCWFFIASFKFICLLVLYQKIWQFFLQRMFFPKIRDNISPMNDRKIKSIAQDICYTVCKGAWLLPKHLLLGMSVHHLTGSAQLVTLLNRFGHCVSYSSVLQLETSIAEKIIISDSVLPTDMLNMNNIITH